MLHGPYGEDGTIQGLLELANVAYVGCGVLASAVGMDKAVMKVLFRARGLRVPDWLVVLRAATGGRIARRSSRAIEAALAYPLFVKPANLGSSVGISKVHGRVGARRRRSIWRCDFDRKVVVEAAVPRRARDRVRRARQRRARGVGARRDRAVARVLRLRSEVHRQPDRARRFPRALDRRRSPTRSSGRRVAAFQAIDGAGLARVDFLLEQPTGELFVNEINTLPGFTTISMFSKLWAASGVDYPTLVDRLITLALERHAEKQDLSTSAF